MHLVESKLSLSVRQLDALKVTIFLLTSLRRLKIKETKCTRANIVQNSNSLSLNFQLQAAPCSALGHTILGGDHDQRYLYFGNPGLEELS